MSETPWKEPKADRRYFVGGSDARVIMGDDEAALLRLWREKRGEIEPELSSTLRIFARVLDAGPEDCRFRNNARGLFDAGCHASEGAERNPSFLR